MTSEELQPIVAAEPRLLYDRKSAAYLLSISVRQMDRLIAEKHLNTTRVFGRVLIHRKELEKFARSNHYLSDLKGSRRRPDDAEPN